MPSTPTTALPANYNTPNYVNAMAVQPGNRNVMIGGSFIRLGGGYAATMSTFAGMSPASSALPPSGRKASNLPFGMGNPNPGPTCQNYPGNVGFTQGTYSANDTANSTFISMTRINGALGPVNIVLGTNTCPPDPAPPPTMTLA